jgi:hypothetical protein
MAKMISMGLLFLLIVLLVPAALASIGLQFAEDRSEEMLFLKLLGYALLGAFTFRINSLPLPVGYVIALLISANVTVNRKSRRMTATIAFVLFLLILPLIGSFIASN